MSLLSASITLLSGLVATSAACGGPTNSRPVQATPTPTNTPSKSPPRILVSLETLTEVHLSDLVDKYRPELASKARMTTRSLARSDISVPPVVRELHNGFQQLTHCVPGECAEALRRTDFGWSTAEILTSPPAGDDVRSAFIIPGYSGPTVSGYAGVSASTHQAANSSNHLECFTMNARTGKRLSLGDFDPAIDIPALIEKKRSESRKEGFGDPLANFQINPESIRIERMEGRNSNRVVLCATSNTNVTEGFVVEIPVFEDVSLACHEHEYLLQRERARYGMPVPARWRESLTPAREQSAPPPTALHKIRFHARQLTECLQRPDQVVLNPGHRNAIDAFARDPAASLPKIAISEGQLLPPTERHGWVENPHYAIGPRTPVEGHTSLAGLGLSSETKAVLRAQGVVLAAIVNIHAPGSDCQENDDGPPSCESHAFATFFFDVDGKIKGLGPEAYD